MKNTKSNSVGTLVICDMEQAIINLPENALRIRLRQNRRKLPVYFFIRLSDGIKKFAGSLENGSIRLIALANGEARTRKTIRENPCSSVAKK